MVNVKFFICKKCGSVLCVDPKYFNDTFRCTKCNGPVESVDDNFDLSEIADNVKEDSQQEFPKLYQVSNHQYLNLSQGQTGV